LRRRIVSPVENIQAGPAEPGIVVLDSQRCPQLDAER
jgi:hypothetical protein